MSMPADYLTKEEFHTTLTLRLLELRKEFQHFVLSQLKEQRRDFQQELIDQQKESKKYADEQTKKTNDYFAVQRQELKKLVIEQRKEFERYTGVLKEHFAGGIEAISEGVEMNVEKTERLEQFSKKEFDGLDRRLSQFEMTRARKRILKEEASRKISKKRKQK